VTSSASSAHIAALAASLSAAVAPEVLASLAFEYAFSAAATLDRASIIFFS
jgi:hypothetical protein